MSDDLKWTDIFTCPNDGWTGLCIKLCVEMLVMTTIILACLAITPVMSSHSWVLKGGFLFHFVITVSGSKFTGLVVLNSHLVRSVLLLANQHQSNMCNTQTTNTVLSVSIEKTHLNHIYIL